MREISFDNSDSQAIKAVSIIVIVLHNFVHITNDIGENEFALDPGRILVLWSHVQEQPLAVLNYVFSYFGWYFVVPFMFISGYGLTKKCLKGKEGTIVLATSAIFKVAILLLAGTVFIWLTGFASRDEAVSILYHKLATIDNLTADQVTSGVGPWWYFSFVIQLYLLFPLVYKIVAWRRSGVLLALVPSYIAIYALYLLVPKLAIFGTILGHLPILALGVYLAYYKNALGAGAAAVLGVAAFVVFLLSQRYQVFFPLTYLSFLILFLLFYRCISGLKNYPLVDLLGKASAFIFVLNGPMRDQTRDMIYRSSGMYPRLHDVVILAMSFMHLLAVLAVSLMVYMFLDDAMRKLGSRFHRALTAQTP